MESEQESARSLLIVEDDAAFARTLHRSFERRGYTVMVASNLDEVTKLLEAHTPQYAVVDLKLAGGASGLACVQTLHAHDPDMLIVVLTGYASIATAVEAIEYMFRMAKVYLDWLPIHAALEFIRERS